VNALDMLGGFTASAGPIGGADTSGTTEAGAGDIAAGFDALVAKALGAATDEEPALAAADDETDPATPGLDVSVMLAMAGLVPFQVATPVAPVVMPQTTAGDVVIDRAPAIDQADHVVGVALDTLPCTLVPGGEAIASSSTPVSARGEAPADDQVAGTEVAQDAPAAPVETIPVVATTLTAAPTPTPIQGTTPLPVAATPMKGETAIQPKDIGPQDAAASPALATGAPSDPSRPVEGAPLEAPMADAAPAAPTAGPAHPALRARLTRAARAVNDQGLQLDDAGRQAASELRGALSAPARAEATDITRPTPSASAPVEAAAVARGSGGVQPAKSAEAAPTVDMAIAVSGGVVATGETAGQTSQFGPRGDASRDEASGRPAVVSVTGVRAEAAIQAFNSLSVEPARQVDATVDVAPNPVAESGAPVATPQESAQNVQSMVRAMRLHFTDGGGEARLQLNPEHLGQVTLTVKVEQGRVAAHIQAETADASRWIETHQSTLRSALEDQGLDVKELVVTTDPDGRRQREPSQPDQQPRARSQRRTADGQTPKFEVLA
jgi:flagellar hook-length control protein FliK